MLMWQDGFRPQDIQHKTMRTMDKHIRDAMMPDYELFEVDLTEGTRFFFCMKYALKCFNMFQYVSICFNMFQYLTLPFEQPTTDPIS